MPKQRKFRGRTSRATKYRRSRSSDSPTAPSPYAAGTVLVVRDGIHPSAVRTGGNPQAASTSSAALDEQQLRDLFSAG